MPRFLIDTFQPTLVEFEGSNFGPSLEAVTSFEHCLPSTSMSFRVCSQITVGYGVLGQSSAYKCAVQPESTHTFIRCETEAYSAGSGMVFTVDVGG